MTLPKSDREGRCQFHRWVPDDLTPGMEFCQNCDRTRRREVKPNPVLEQLRKEKLTRGAMRKSSLKSGRGFAASPAQREKVKHMACVFCGVMEADGWTEVDPAHICARGAGGCDEPWCVIPLCRLHHEAFDRGEIDVLASLEPTFRAEVAHAVTHLGLEGTRRRLAPSQYERKAAA